MAKRKTDKKADDGQATLEPDPTGAENDAEEAEKDAFIGPSPNPKTNLILADLALRGGSILLRQGLERSLLGRKYMPDKAGKILKGRSMGESIMASAIVKVATRSVPGAIVVGGGLLAKTLYDRRKARQARIDGEAALDKLAEDGYSEEG